MSLSAPPHFPMAALAILGTLTGSFVAFIVINNIPTPLDYISTSPAPAFLLELTSHCPSSPLLPEHWCGSIWRRGRLLLVALPLVLVLYSGLRRRCKFACLLCVALRCFALFTLLACTKRNPRANPPVFQCMGFLVACWIFATPLTEFNVFTNSFNFGMTFACATLLVPTLLLLKPRLVGTGRGMPGFMSSLQVAS